ncbi:MAG: phytanoyl-CoA dioxygenase [Bacilli bacterium]|nr:phytanoyl-CoA dioxygenase [Bacilli bacterium]
MRFEHHCVQDVSFLLRSPDHRGANYCKELSNSSVITNLLIKTPAWELAESVIGAGRIHPVHSGVQIALRFPTMEDQPANFAPHLDGVLKVKEGIVQNFTALVGILLNDLPDTYMGNFTVYPGTHRQYEQYFREHGPEVMLTEEAFATKHHSPNVPLPERVQITGQAGDMIIVHYQLIHAAGPNLSDQIRYACFFRLDHVDRSKDWKAPLTDLWMHWPGIREMLPEL